MYVKPAPGLMLRDPVTKQLLSAAPVEGIKTTVVPSGGLQVDDNDMYWRRRLRDGDAVRVPSTPVAAAAGNASAPAAAAPATEKTSS
ncbi:DUF2635 domain-containing protein [Paraburkholderia acidiphila]|uniref:DUF2635 domain-containing protein n=1 Tax=Paraburkholderia acidiphila TaxID=2571747 RepID=A0A7Z2J9U8_9BURK|nr:DUF2635 domain-containing protein [Paraburkholderia acidiphila]QGZ56751.1 DUF2635 domain-containing protein [Paraburkholderia acidiphila]